MKNKKKFKPLSQKLYLSFVFILSHKQNEGPFVTAAAHTIHSTQNETLNLLIWEYVSSSFNSETFRIQSTAIRHEATFLHEVRNDLSMPINMLTPNTWNILHGRARTCMPTTSLVLWCASDPITSGMSVLSFTTKVDLSHSLQPDLNAAQFYFIMHFGKIFFQLTPWWFVHPCGHSWFLIRKKE